MDRTPAWTSAHGTWRRQSAARCCQNVAGWRRDDINGPEQFLRQPVSKRIDTSVITLDRPVWGAGLAGSFPRYNPDDLVGKKGLAIYAKMRTDEQVKAVCTFKRDAILSRGYSFDFDENTPPRPSVIVITRQVGG